MAVLIGGRPAERAQESGDRGRQAGQVTQGAPILQGQRHHAQGGTLCQDLLAREGQTRADVACSLLPSRCGRGAASP
jgi:hypothetical protein